MFNFIDNWKEAWKMWSMRADLINLLLQLLYYYVETFSTSLGTTWYLVLTTVLTIASMYLRVLKQKNITGTEQ